MKTAPTINCCDKGHTYIKWDYDYIDPWFSIIVDKDTANFVLMDNETLRIDINYCPFCGKPIEIGDEQQHNQDH